MSTLTLTRLSKHFGALPVTKAVSLDIHSGELHAVIGPNGAGKTTLVKQLSGELAPDSGEIYFEGNNITRLSMPERVKAGMARTFQITSVLPGLSVLENVALVIQARSGSSFRFFAPVANEVVLNQEAFFYLEQVGLADQSTSLASVLAHGDHRRLELCLALASKPQLLLLDEPLAGTGGQDAESLITLLAGLKGKITTVLIEHDMQAVFALADRISVLVYGEIIATGTPAEIRDNPAVRKAYLGEEDVASC